MDRLYSIYLNFYDFSEFYDNNKRPASYLKFFEPIIPFKDLFKNPPPPPPKPNMFVQLFVNFHAVTHTLILNLLSNPKKNTIEALSASFVLMACLAIYYKATGRFDKSVIESISNNNKEQLHNTLEDMFNVENLEQLSTQNYIEIVNEPVNPNLETIIIANLENTFNEKYGFKVKISIDGNIYNFNKK